MILLVHKKTLQLSVLSGCMNLISFQTAFLILIRCHRRWNTIKGPQSDLAFCMGEKRPENTQTENEANKKNTYIKAADSQYLLFILHVQQIPTWEQGCLLAGNVREHCYTYHDTDFEKPKSNCSPFFSHNPQHLRCHHKCFKWYNMETKKDKYATPCNGDKAPKYVLET